MVFAVLQLGTGNEAPQALQVTGNAPAVEAAHLHLHHLAVFLQLAHFFPGLAQGQGPGAHGHHAIGVLFPGDEHLHLSALGEAGF